MAFTKIVNFSSSSISIPVTIGGGTLAGPGSVVVGYDIQAVGAALAAAGITNYGLSSVSSNGLNVTPSPAGTFNIIYVKTTGNDLTGDGTLAKPFRTFERAELLVNTVVKGDSTIIDVSFIGKEVFLAEHVMPPILSGNITAQIPNATGVGATIISGAPAGQMRVTNLTNISSLYGVLTLSGSSHSGNNSSFIIQELIDNQTCDVINPNAVVPDSTPLTWTASPNVYFTGAIPYNIIARPAVDDTIVAAAITSTSQNTSTLLRSYTTTKSYTLNQYKGFFLLGSGAGQIAAIIGNTAGPNSVIETNNATNFTAPLSIVHCSAEFNRAAATGRPALFNLLNAASNYSFQGIKFSYDVVNDNNSFEVTEHGVLTLSMCDFDCSFRMVRCTFTTIAGVIARRNIRWAGTLPMGISQLYAWGQAATITLRQRESMKWIYTGCVFENTTTVGHGGDNAGGSNVPSGPVAMSGVSIRSNTGDGITQDGDGNFDLRNVEILNSVRSAIRAQVPANVFCLNVHGTGNGRYGMEFDGGATAQISGTAPASPAVALTDVTGTMGDMKVGAMAARTWSDFRSNFPLDNQFDVPGFTGSADGYATGARIWQG